MGGKYKGKHVAGNIDRPEAITDDTTGNGSDDSQREDGRGAGINDSDDARRVPGELEDGYAS